MFKVVLQITMRLHEYLNNNGADAGRFFCKRLRVWHRQARASCRSSFDSRGPFLCIFVKLGRLLQLGHVGSCCCLAGRARACTASECPARSRTRARSAPSCGKQLQLWRERRTPASRLAAPPLTCRLHRATFASQVLRRLPPRASTTFHVQQRFSQLRPLHQDPTAGRGCSLSLHLPLLPLIPFVSPTS